MAQVAEIFQMVRQRLGKPTLVSLTPDILLQAIWDRTQFYAIKMRNDSNEGLRMRNFKIQVIGGLDDYPISYADFGGAFLIHTDPDMYADGRRREVDIVRLQDLDLATTPVRITGDDDSVEAMSFYVNDVGWNMRASPRGSSGYYIVWYEPVGASQQALTNSPQIPVAFHPMLSIAVAFDVADHCAWEGVGPEEAMGRRQSFKASLLQQKVEWEREWDTYIRSVNHEDTGFVSPFATSPDVYARYRGGW
jgi:hypothetical protein